MWHFKINKFPKAVEAKLLKHCEVSQVFEKDYLWSKFYLLNRRPWFSFTFRVFSDFLKFDLILKNACTQTANRFFLQRNAKLYSCTKNLIRFFTYFENCTQIIILFFTMKYKVLRLNPNGALFFYSEIQHFENYTQTTTRFLTTKYEFFDVVPKCRFVFPSRKYET